MEYPAFFKNDSGMNLYSVLYRPPAIRGCGFVFCAPVFGERSKCHRVAVTFARRLAALGHPLLRFDYWGEGDSEGDVQEAGIDSRIRDIISAVRYLRRAAGTERVVLVGLRLGATLAAMAAKRLDCAAGAVLWAPIPRVREYLYDCLRANLSHQLTEHRKIVATREQLVEKLRSGEIVNVDGWDFTGRLWNEGVHVDLERELAALKIPVLVTMLGRAAAPENNVRENNVQSERLPQEFSWKDWDGYNPRPEQLFARSIAWIGEKLP